MERETSKVSMCLTSSSGTWLNGSLQPQHYFVSLDVKDPEGKELARVALTYEQAARMMLYNGDVECTLMRYRGIDGKMTEEKVEPPKTVHQRMKERLGETQVSLLKRVEDVRRDLYDMINGDEKRSKTKIKEMYDNIATIKAHLQGNEAFVVQQAEEELGEMQSNAAGQLGIFLQTKGLDAPAEALKQLLPVSNGPLLIGEEVKPVQDSYELKARPGKSIDSMTAMQVADVMSKRLRQLEQLENAVNVDRIEKSEQDKHLYNSGASETRSGKVSICYIGYQGHHTIELDEAKAYLKFLYSIKTIDEFKSHWHFNKGD